MPSQGLVISPLALILEQVCSRTLAPTYAGSYICWRALLKTDQDSQTGQNSSRFASVYLVIVVWENRFNNTKHKPRDRHPREFRGELFG